MYHLKVLLIVPVVMVLMVFFLMKDAKKEIWLKKRKDGPKRFINSNVWLYEHSVMF